ncbi:cobalamin B12-binding domain-containing protein [Desulforhopalus sp. 52FAK]
MKSVAGSSEQPLFEEALLSMDKDTVFALAAKHTSVSTLTEELLVPSLENIGAGWEQGYIALAQVYISAGMCEDVLQRVLNESVEDKIREPQLAVVLLEDYHALGKMIVLSSLSAAGYRVLDLGRMDVEEIITYLKQSSIEVLLVSVLMLPSALRVRDLKERLTQENIQTKLVVGGAPFRLDETLWREVGADACGKVASDAIEIVKNLLGEKT